MGSTSHHVPCVAQRAQESFNIRYANAKLDRTAERGRDGFAFQPIESRY
jgi:hypothetical protein